MAENTNQKRTRRRKAKRPTLAELSTYADNGQAMGSAGRRIFLNVRLSLWREQMRAIFQISRFFNYSASDTMRHAIRYGAAEGNAERKAIISKYEAKAQKAVDAARRYEPRRTHYMRQRLPSKTEAWAKGEGRRIDKGRNVFNLTCHDLAEIAAELDEIRLADYREANGENRKGEQRTLQPSFSMAARRLISLFLHLISKLIQAANARANGLEIASLEYEPPTRAKRWSTRREARRPIKEQGTKASL